MLTVEKLMQITHPTPDVVSRRKLEDLYLDIFGAQTYFEARPQEGLDRDETLILIADVSLIPVAPLDPTSPQGRIRASYAGRFMSMALKIVNVPDADGHLQNRGLHPQYHHPVYKDVFFLTDPAETFGVRYEMCAVEMPNDLRNRPEWSADWWLNSHPLGIEKLQSVSTAVADLEKAKQFYRDAFDLQYLGQRDLAVEGAKAAAFKVGNKIPFVLEVMQPVAKHTQLADWTAKYREGIYSVTFKVRSLARAADYLKAKGLRLVGDLKQRFTIDPAGLYGGVFTFVDKELPL